MGIAHEEDDYTDGRQPSLAACFAFGRLEQAFRECGFFRRAPSPLTADKRGSSFGGGEL
jgi:hypothetical protein